MIQSMFFSALMKTNYFFVFIPRWLFCFRLFLKENESISIQTTHTSVWSLLAQIRRECFSMQKNHLNLKNQDTSQIFFFFANARATTEVKTYFKNNCFVCERICFWKQLCYCLNLLLNFLKFTVAKARFPLDVFVRAHSKKILCDVNLILKIASRLQANKKSWEIWTFFVRSRE